MITTNRLESNPMVEPTPEADTNIDRLWPQFRRLLVLQVKLYVDAFRDLLLSLLSLGAFVLDLLSQKQGKNSYFERVLKFGRRTDRSINLFDQYSARRRGPASVDSIIDEVEERIRNR